MLHWFIIFKGLDYCFDLPLTEDRASTASMSIEEAVWAEVVVIVNPGENGLRTTGDRLCPLTRIEMTETYLMYRLKSFSTPWVFCFYG